MRSHRGFTLMEMVLVLAVIVAVAAVALPMLQGPMQDQRLKKTGDVIRAEWAKAKARAMQTGRIHLFRYQPGSDLYAIEPWVDETDATEGLGAATNASAALPPQINAQSALSPLGIRGVKLPEGITFFSGQAETDSRAADAVEDSSAGGAAGLAPPIVFYPDGSSSDAKLVLTNQRFFLELRLRGLTGIARVSDLLAPQELGQ